MPGKISSARARVQVARIATEGLIVLVALAIAAWVWKADDFWFELHANACRCIRDPRTLSRGSLLRWSMLAISLFLALWLRPRASRWIAGSATPFASSARYVIAIVLALGCAELVLRRPGPVLPLPPEGYCPTHIPNAALGWSLAPNAHHEWHAGGRTFEYAVNADGNRASSIVSNSDRQRPTILLGGESIAMAMGVPYDEGFGALLESRTGLQVVDLGVDAYGLDQAFARERDELPKYEHPVAIVTVFHPEVAERAEVEDRSRLRIGEDGALVLVPPTPAWIRDIRLRHVFRELYHSSAELEDLKAIVRATLALAKQRGAYPLFVTMNFLEPCLAVNGREPALFRDLFDEQNAPRVHVFLPANERLSDDPHPNPLAHRRIADAVEKALQAAHVLPTLGAHGALRE